MLEAVRDLELPLEALVLGWIAYHHLVGDFQ